MLGRPVSLAQQVKQHLLDRIAKDALADSEGRLPSEPQLSQELGVSRATVREAMTMLAREGVVIRRQGIGTFVNHNLRELETNIAEVVEFEELIIGQGYQADVRLIRSGIQAAGGMAASLEVDEGAQVLVVEKIFLADETPVIYCLNALPVHLVLPGQRANLTDGAALEEPIYRFLHDNCRQDVLYHISDIGAAVADEALADQLACGPGHPLLCIEEVGFNNEQNPVLYCLEYYRNDMMHFQAVRKTVRPFSWEQPGAGRGAG